MDQDRNTPTLTDVQARSGETPHIVRYVLLISTSLAIVALGSAYVYFGWL